MYNLFPFDTDYKNSYKMLNPMTRSRSKYICSLIFDMALFEGHILRELLMRTILAKLNLKEIKKFKTILKLFKLS